MKNNTLRLFDFYMVLPILSGILIGLTFISDNSIWTLPYCFVPLWLFVMSTNGWCRKISGGLIATLLYWTIVMHWLVQPMQNFLRISELEAIFLFLVPGTLANFFYIALPVLIVEFLRNSFKLRIGHCIFLLILLSSQAFFPRPFGSNMGLPWLWSTTSFPQFADLIGVSGLSLFTFSLNAGFFWLFWFLKQKEKRSKQLSFLTAGLALFLVLNFSAKKHGNQFSKTSETIQAIVVQPLQKPISFYIDKNPKTFREDLLKNIVDQTDEAMKVAESSAHAQTNGAILIVWPESTFPFALNDYPLFIDKLQNSLKGRNAAILLGSALKQNRSISTGSILITAQSMQFVPKHYLIPFAEFSVITNVKDWWQGRASVFHNPKGSSYLNFNELKLATTTCYDIVFSEYVNRLTQERPNILINIANDYWFGESSEQKFNTATARGRALEIRRPLIRAGNVGISLIADAQGNILQQIPAWKSGVINRSLGYSLNQPLTFYSRYKHLVDLAPLLLFLLVFCYALYFRKEKMA